MSKPNVMRSDREAQRIGLLAEMERDQGRGWGEQYAPGAPGCHELLDRTALLLDWLERHVIEHPACVGNEEWFALAAQAADALQSLYQRVGVAHLAPDQPSASPAGKQPRGPRQRKIALDE